MTSHKRCALFTVIALLTVVSCGTLPVPATSVNVLIIDEIGITRPEAISLAKQTTQSYRFDAIIFISDPSAFPPPEDGFIPQFHGAIIHAFTEQDTIKEAINRATDFINERALPKRNKGVIVLYTTSTVRENNIDTLVTAQEQGIDIFILNPEPKPRLNARSAPSTRYGPHFMY